MKGHPVATVISVLIVAIAAIEIASIIVLHQA